MKLSTEVLVLGAGATGLGAGWDSALRGFKTLVLEKGDLAHGTSGRYHGLLHSGGRYVISDPKSAQECASENALLRRLLPSAIEDTGGLFVAAPVDPADYGDEFLAACARLGVPAAEISVANALQREPLLNPNLRRAFEVQDAACDSFDALHLLAEAVRAAGGEVLLRHRVNGFVRQGNRVAGVSGEALGTGEPFVIYADIILNCTGAWAGHIAQLAGCRVRVTAGKGVMIAMNSRLVNTVVNRLKPPADGDIIVPVGTVSVIGTTDTAVPNPDQYAIEDAEIDLLMAEGEVLLPRLKQFRALRAWAGVRPLYEEAAPEKESRLMSRAHQLLDHETRDGVSGMLSMVGGKFTTFRLMAEQLVDAACVKLQSPRPCQTRAAVAEPARSKLHTLPKRLAEAELSPPKTHDPVVCECELVTRSQIENHLQRSGSPILNDLRRDLRLGMGPCQAGFCAYRAAGIVHDSLLPSANATNAGLTQFMQERWKGERPVLWGHSLRSLELDLHIYRNLLAIHRLPTDRDIEAYPTEKTS